MRKVKIEEVIKQLTEIKNTHGNVNVARRETEMDNYYDVEKIEVFENTFGSGYTYVGIK